MRLVGGVRCGRCGLAVGGGVELVLDAGDAFFEYGDGLAPGLEGLGGVAGVEGAGMRLFGREAAFGFFEAGFKVGVALGEVGRID
jgi:hypothetical protein